MLLYGQMMLLVQEKSIYRNNIYIYIGLFEFDLPTSSDLK